jgi:hypothetical protein
MLASPGAVADEPLEESADAGPDVGGIDEPADVPDYAPVAAWNGLGGWLDRARRAGIDVSFGLPDDPPPEPSVTLVLIYPDALPDAEGLREYVARGGRLLVADDFGLGDAVSAVFGVGRRAPPRFPFDAWRGDPDLPVALPTGPHPAVDRVEAVLANHPTTLDPGPLARCLLAFSAPESPCLMAEAPHGYGSAVFLADPSVLVDQMQQVEGNRLLADGLLRYLTTNRPAAVTIVLPDGARRIAIPPAAPPVGIAAAARRVLQRASALLADLPMPVWILAALAVLLLAVAGRIRFPSAEDEHPPRLLPTDRAGPETAYPSPASADAWRAFSLDALDVMRATADRHLAETEAALKRARGGGLRRRLRLRLERSRAIGFRRRLLDESIAGTAPPSLPALRKLAAEFVRLQAGAGGRG